MNKDFTTIYEIVKAKGKHFGGEHNIPDRWELVVENEMGFGLTVIARLEDGGYTRVVAVANLLNVVENCNDKLTFYNGDEKILVIIARIVAA